MLYSLRAYPLTSVLHMFYLKPVNSLKLLQSTLAITHFFGVHNDNIVAHVLVGPKGGLVLAAQESGNLRGQSADRLVLGVHQVPAALESLARK